MTQVNDLYAAPEAGLSVHDLSRSQRILLCAEPSGLLGSEMDEAQQRYPLSIVDHFLARHPQPIAAKLQQDVRDSGLDHVHFAWAGDTRAKTSHYFRIQTGP
jgi:hypothetical protein